MPRPEGGVALLEVLVALAVLATAGLALVGLMSAGARSEREARERERILATEERFLTALTLLKREELDRRIGWHPLGEFIVEIQRPERTLYRVAIAESRSPGLEDLVTVVYRPEPAHAR